MKDRQARAEVGSQGREMPPGSMQWDEPSFHCGPWYAKDRWQEWGLPMPGPGGGTPITGSLRHILAPSLCAFSFGNLTNEQNPTTHWLRP